MKNVLALFYLFIINAETILADDHSPAELQEQIKELDELQERLDNLVDEIRIEERVSTELEELNSEDATRPKACCYAVPKKNPDLEARYYNNLARYYNNLDFSEPACMLPSHRSELEDINPFETTEDQCNAIIVNGTHLCSELSSNKNAKPFCVVWSDTCPWDDLLSHSSCAECTNATSCTAASSSTVVWWIIAAAIMVIAGFAFFLVANNTATNSSVDK